MRCYTGATNNLSLLILLLLSILRIALFIDELCKYVDYTVVVVVVVVFDEDEKDASVPHHFVRYINTSISWCNYPNRYVYNYFFYTQREEEDDSIIYVNTSASHLLCDCAVDLLDYIT